MLVASEREKHHLLSCHHRAEPSHVYKPAALSKHRAGDERPANTKMDKLLKCMEERWGCLINAKKCVSQTTVI